VDHPHLLVARKQGSVEIAIQFVQGRFHPIAYEVHLDWHIHLMGGIGGQHHLWGMSGFHSCILSNCHQIRQATPNPLAVHHDLGRVPLDLLQTPIPAQRAMTHLSADHGGHLCGLVQLYLWGLLE